MNERKANSTFRVPFCRKKTGQPLTQTNPLSGKQGGNKGGRGGDVIDGRGAVAAAGGGAVVEELREGHPTLRRRAAAAVDQTNTKI